MINAYIQGKDLYAVIASTLYGVPYEECLEFHVDEKGNKLKDEHGVEIVNHEGKTRRQNTKSVLLGLMYGRQAKSISEQMGVSIKEANKVIKDFFKKFPKVAEYISYVQDMATEKGYVLTATGHRCRIPDMMLPQYEFSYIDQSKSANFDPLSFGEQDVDENVVPEHLVEQYWNELDRAWGFKKKREIIERAEQQDGIKIVDNGGKIAEAERQCLNSVIQGSASEITKYAMIKVHNDRELKELGFHLMIPVHDELLGEIPRENAKRGAERLTEVMIEAARDIVDIPMKCDPSVVERWYGEEISV